MDLVCDERGSDSPFVETIWHSQGAPAGPFISMAGIGCGLVVTKYRGETILTVRGPETRATPAFCPPEAEFIGIQFKTGAFMRAFTPKTVMDRRDVNLPEATSRSFWLHGSAWEYPDFENADTFVDRLVRDGLLAHDPVVVSVLQGEPVEMSLRTVQRRFSQATGLTQSTIYQITRARHATKLLKLGVSVLDAAFEAGYFDQPHLTRSLKYYTGLTPAQISDSNRTERLSFLYKKTTPWPSYNTNVLRMIGVQSQPVPALDVLSFSDKETYGKSNL